MGYNVKSLIDTLGGRKRVADTLDCSIKNVDSFVAAGVIPARLYLRIRAVCAAHSDVLPSRALSFSVSCRLDRSSRS